MQARAIENPRDKTIVLAILGVDPGQFNSVCMVQTRERLSITATGRFTVLHFVRDAHDGISRHHANMRTGIQHSSMLTPDHKYTETEQSCRLEEPLGIATVLPLNRHELSLSALDGMSRAGLKAAQRLLPPPGAVSVRRVALNG